MNPYTRPVVFVTTNKDCANQKCAARSGMGMCKTTFVKK